MHGVLVLTCRFCVLLFSAQAVNPETMENLIGSELPVKFLEIDEEKERLVFSNKRVAGASTADLQGYKVRGRERKQGKLPTHACSLWRAESLANISLSAVVLSLHAT